MPAPKLYSLHYIMILNLKKFVLLALFALSFAAAYPKFLVFKSREQHVPPDRRVLIPLIKRVVTTEGAAVAKESTIPTVTSVIATKSLDYNTATITASYGDSIKPVLILPTPIVTKKIDHVIVPPIVLQAAAGIGVGLAGVAASAIGAYYYIKNKTKGGDNGDNNDDNNDDNKDNKDGTREVKDDKDEPKQIFIQHHGDSKDFKDPDDDDTAKFSPKEPTFATIHGSQAASTSMVDLKQDTVGSVGMERHHSD
ncbi:5642_t:CDS:2 [Scutellospora calospora]|uniref:5642_t:CDS:1 n=1 Tax=Scutellospora calospora TaxID=85575 RepID=A0ACA9LG83_9GLOM|nr:5642_t:CDS:2 [Scutellospora calospora]